MRKSRIFPGEGVRGIFKFWGGPRHFDHMNLRNLIFPVEKLHPPADPRTVHLCRFSINHHILYNGIFLMDPKSDSCQ